MVESVEALPLVYKGIVLIPPFVFCAWFWGQRANSIFYTFRIQSHVLRQAYIFFQNRAFFENIYYYFLVRPILTTMYFSFFIEVEKFSMEFLTVSAPSLLVSKFSSRAAQLHTTPLVSQISVFMVVILLSIVLTLGVCI